LRRAEPVQDEGTRGRDGSAKIPSNKQNTAEVVCAYRERENLGPFSRQEFAAQRRNL